jgi:hypothetical protein
MPRTWEQELSGGRIIRCRIVGKSVNTEVIQNGKIIQRNKLGEIEGRTLKIEFVITESGDGVQRPPISCPSCRKRMDHLPNLCTNWLPNGTYLCSNCGFHWWGTPGLVEESPQSVPPGTTFLTT